jgi:hypothetical protein
MTTPPDMSPEAPLVALVRDQIVKGKSLSTLVHEARLRRKRRVVEEPIESLSEVLERAKKVREENPA